MTTLLVSISAFIVGLCLGVFIKTKAFDDQDWSMLKWNTNCLGYRTVSFGSKLMRGDKVIMALHLNTNEFPEEGVVYDVD
jgi:hypothetical protein